MIPYLEALYILREGARRSRLSAEVSFDAGNIWQQRIAKQWTEVENNIHDLLRDPVILHRLGELQEQKDAEEKIQYNKELGREVPFGPHPI